MESTTLNNWSRIFGTNMTLNATTIPSVQSWPTNVVLCYLAIILMLGVPGNALLLVAQYRNRNKSTTDYLVATMATFELICSSAVTTMNILRYSPHLWRIIATDFTCKLNMFISFYNAMASNILLVAIATDRYIKTCLPHNNFYSNRASKYVCVAISVFSLISGIPGLACYTVDDTHDCIPVEMYSKFVNDFKMALVTVTFLGFVLLCFTYLKISLTLRQRQRLRQTVMTASTTTEASTRSLRNVFSSFQKKNKIQPKGHQTTSTEIVEKGSSSNTAPSIVLSTMEQVQSAGKQSTPSSLPVSLEITSLCRQPPKASTGIEHIGNVAHKAQSPTLPGSSIVPEIPSVRLAQGSERDRQIINKTTKITFLITVIYAASYILAWMFIFISQSGYGEVLGMFAGTIHLVNCVSNPILFFSMSSKFRQMLKEIFCQQ